MWNWSMNFVLFMIYVFIFTSLQFFCLLGLFAVWKERFEHCCRRVLYSCCMTTGDIYMWDGKKCKSEAPVATHLHGVKNATSVCVGETHLLVICGLYHPDYLTSPCMSDKKQVSEKREELEELDEELIFMDIQEDESSSIGQSYDSSSRPVPSLKSLCEKGRSRISCGAKQCNTTS